MRLLANIFAGALLLLAGAPPPAAEKGPKPPTCDPDGRYWVHHDKGQKVYCFDGDGFAAASAPPHVKGYFEPAPAAPAGPVPVRPKTIGPGDSKAFTGVPSLPTGGSGGGGGGGFSLSGGGGSSGTTAKPSAVKDLEKMMGHGALGGYEEDGSGADPGKAKRGGPLPAQAMSLIAVGMSRTQVRTKLGAPHGRILNSGDEGSYEIWTYLLEDGGSGSVRIRDGRVVSLRLP